MDGKPQVTEYSEYIVLCQRLTSAATLKTKPEREALETFLFHLYSLACGVERRMSGEGRLGFKATLGNFVNCSLEGNGREDGRGILVPGKRDISSSLSSFPLSPSAENRIRIEFRQKGGGGVDFPTKMTKKLVIFSLVGKKLVLRNNIIPNAVYPF